VTKNVSMNTAIADVQDPIARRRNRHGGLNFSRAAKRN